MKNNDNDKRKEYSEKHDMSTPESGLNELIIDNDEYA